jgi:hypothetical protein
MLFDLRGRGRRRTIQGIYLGLALLMGGGLVFFGVGGTGVGLFNNDNSSGGGGDSQHLLKTAEARVRAHPRDAEAWGQLAYQRYIASRNNSKYFDQANNAYKPAGLQLLRGSEQAWDRYIALHPRKPDLTVANTMGQQVFGSEGLNEPKKAVQALELAAQADSNNYNAFLTLARVAYAAKQDRKAALAGQRAIELAPPDQRSGIRGLLASYKKQASGGARQPTAQPTPQPTPTPAPAGP